MTLPYPYWAFLRSFGQLFVTLLPTKPSFLQIFLLYHFKSLYNLLELFPLKLCE